MDEPTKEPEVVKPPEPKMDDVGTRIQHLLDYKDSLEICLNISQKRGNFQGAAKFMTALEVVSTTIDAFSGYREAHVEYSLYKLLNSVPKTKEALKSIGGMPLEESR